MTGINNNHLFINSKRIMPAAPTEKVIKKALTEGNETPVPNSSAEAVKSDTTPLVEIKPNLLLETRNIHIFDISRSSDTNNEEDLSDDSGESGESEHTEQQPVSTNDTETHTVAGCYTTEELKNTYRLTDLDISIFFKKENDKYVIRQDAVKACFGIEDIKTISQLLDAMKNDGYTEGYVRGAYNLSSAQTAKYLILVSKEPKRYILNQDAIKADFPDKEITTLGQLKDAKPNNVISTNTDSNTKPADGTVTNENKTELINDLKTAFINGDSSWGFQNLRPDAEQAENLYNSLIADEEIKNFSGTKSEFIKLLKTKSAELIANIKDRITAFSAGELFGRYGLPRTAIDLFFTKQDDGTYKMNMDGINEFWGKGYQRDTLAKLVEFINSYGLGSKRKMQICEVITNALRNGDSGWGFNDIDPELTEKEIQSFYNQIKNLDEKGSKSLSSFENLVRQKLPEILNNVQLQRFNSMIEGNDFNQFVSAEKVNEYINKYVELVKKELNSYGDYHNGWKCKYSPNYIDSIIEFAIKDLNISKSANADFYNLKNILNKLQSNIHTLTSGGSGLPYTLTRFNDRSNYISHQPVLFYIDYWTDNGDIKEKYFAKMFQDFFEKTGLDEEEQVQYLKKLARDLYPDYIKINTTDTETENTHGILNIMKLLNTNNISELFTRLQRDAKTVGHVEQNDIDKTVKIDDFSTIFGSKTSIDANYIFEHLDEMLISKDPAARKFAQMIQDAFDKYTTFPNNLGIAEAVYEAFGLYKQEKLDVIKHLIEAINYNNGVKDNKTSLSLDTMQKLNSDNVFGTIKEAINSQIFKNACIVNIDGKLGKFGQDKTNDCWFLASLISLNSTKAGQTLIKNAISWADDYSSVTVKFTNGTVTLSVEEITDAILRHISDRQYVSGDMDALILELAYEKLCGDLDGTPSTGQWVSALTTLSPSKLFHHSEDTAGLFTKLTGTYDDTAGGLDDVWALITGDKIDLDDDDVYKFLRKLLNASQQGKPFVATFGLFTDGEETFTWRCVDNTQGKCRLTTAGHMFAITGITATTVTFADPDDSTKTFTVTWGEFARIHIAMVSASFF